MKRTLLLVLLFLILGGGAWYATRANKTRSAGMEAPEMQFAVENPDDIYKIFIADRKGQTATVERKEKYWLYNGQWKARPTAIENLLKTVTQVKVSYLATKAAEQPMIESLASEGLKVEIYNKKGDLKRPETKSDIENYFNSQILKISDFLQGKNEEDKW